MLLFSNQRATAYSIGTRVQTTTSPVMVRSIVNGVANPTAQGVVSTVGSKGTVIAGDYQATLSGVMHTWNMVSWDDTTLVSGWVVVDVLGLAPPTLPTATTLAPGSVATTSAELKGYVNPNGSSSTVYFEYGTTTGYGSQTPSGGIGTTAMNISTTVYGLTPGTTYHYRIVASNSGGTTRGADQPFTTQGQNYTVSVIASPSGGGTYTGDGSFPSGSSRTVTATANPNYTFVNWTENGSVVSPSASYTFTLTGSRNLVANFTPVVVNYTIALSASPPAGGTYTGDGSFPSGSSRTVMATANPNYTFVNWTENGSVVSPSASYTFTLTGNRDLVANFTGTVTPAITSPAPGSTLSSSSVAFQWTSGTGVSEFFLRIGTTTGNNDIYDQSEGLNLSATVTGLPVDGRTLYVELWWSTSAGWQNADYTYNAFFTVQPNLSGRKQGANMVFSWPTSATGYTLQSTTNLGSAAVWSTVSPPPVVVSGQNVVSTPMFGPGMFFRLVHP